MKTVSVTRLGVALTGVFISAACGSSPSEPVPLPTIDSHRLVIASGDALLAVSDTGGTADTLTVLSGRRITLHELSPDGRFAAVLSVEDLASPESATLHVGSLEGGASFVQVTGFSGTPTAFSWSPDSERFVIGTRTPGEIITVSNAGTDLETLVTVPLYGTRPHWSPAGDRIVFVGADTSATNMEGVWTIRPDGTELTRIADETVLQTRPTPRFSPNGEWIAFDFAGDLTVVRADGTGMRQLTTSPSEDEWHFRWSPAGDRIAYVGDAGAYWGVRIMTFPEGALVGVVEGQLSLNVTYPEWSPNGERIAVMGSALNMSAGGSTVAHGPIATVRGEDLSTSALAPLTVVEEHEGRLPQWWAGH